MKKILLSVLLIVSIGNLFAQPVVNRAGNANTVNDGNLFTSRSFRPPVFADTTAANAIPTLDSAGKLIYTFDVNGLWMRQNAPKKWVRVLGSTSTSITNISITNITDSSVNIQICTGDGSCDTTTINNITIESPTTVELINDSTILICNAEAECDTAIINQQQFSYFFQNVLTQISPGIVEFGGAMLHGTSATYNDTSLLELYTSRDIGIPNYPNTRIDPPITNILGTTSLGVIQSVPYINQIRYGLVSGGTVTWVEDYDYHISPAIYYINGAAYSSPDTTITLSAAHPTLDRIDAFVVNENGEVEVVEGTPAADPQQPSIDPETQILLTFALVTAATTQPPGITSECAYQEGTEWLDVSSTARINMESTTSPCAGSKSIEGTAVINGDNFTLSRSVFNPTTSYNVLTFQIKSKGNWGNANQNRRLIISWRNTGIVVGQTVVIANGSYGFNANNTTDCQTISIPLGNFFLPTTAAVTSLHFIAGAANGSFGWYIDNICLQGGGGMTPPTPTTGITSIGSLPPLFNTTTTAGVSTFAQIPQGANEVFIGPASGADANPTFRVLVPADIPTDLGYYKTMLQLTDTSIALIRGDNTRDTIAVSPGDIYALNGLTMRNDSTVVLGGTLDENTTIAAGASYHLNITGSATDYTFSSTNSNATGNAINATGGSSGYGVYASGGTGVQGNSTSGFAVAGITTSGIGIVGDATSGQAGLFRTNQSSTNTVETVATFQRLSSGTAANNIGGQIAFAVAADNGVGFDANYLVSKWTTAASATRTSQFIIAGVNSGTTQNLVTIDGNGTSTFLGPSSPTNTVRAINTTGVAIKAEATSGNGIHSVVTTGRAILGSSSGSDAPARFTIGNATTASNTATLDLLAFSTGSAANGFSGSIDLYLEASDNTNPAGMSIRSVVTDVTAATFTTKIDFYTQKTNNLTKTFTIGGEGYMQLAPITATAASAITPAEGMILFVSNTDATFVSIGIWCYQNGAWKAL